MKPGMAGRTRRRSARASKTNQLVAVGAATKPFGLVVGNRVVVSSPTFITEAPRNRQPRSTVSGSGPSNGVRDLVEKHLVDVVIVGHMGEMARNGDAFFAVVAGTEPGFSVVERKTP